MYIKIFVYELSEEYNYIQIPHKTTIFYCDDTENENYLLNNILNHLNLFSHDLVVIVHMDNNMNEVSRKFCLYSDLKGV